MKKIIAIVIVLFAFQTKAQDNLINSLKGNKSQNAKEQYIFTPTILLETLSVKNQGSSGTCWSYSANSFLESEMLKAGKDPVDLAEIYTARNSYIEKAKNYVRMHGSLNYGDGGEPHDVINMYAQYGALPQEVYSGLTNGATRNNFGEMQTALKGYLDGVIKSKKLTPNWIKGFTAALDSYLGEVPKEFTYKGKKYTPQTFAKEVVGLDARDYIEFVSYQDQPYYQSTFMSVPDNWSFDYAYNVKMDDLTNIIDTALEKGYTIVWATDVSEPYFSWKNGVAYVPQNYNQLTRQEKANLFNGPQPEAQVTEQMRQQAYDDYETTDDHGMHIVGLAKDQNGKDYYIVKNSWGQSNDYKGYLYVTKEFVKYKTTALLVNRKALPKYILKKMDK